MRTTHWTRLDPGKGDLAVCTNAKTWADQHVESLTAASESLASMLTTLDDSWTGLSADSFRERATALKTAIDSSAQALRAAGKAIVAYHDEVAEIKAGATSALTLLSGAESMLSGAYDDMLGVGLDDTSSQNARQDSRDAAAVNIADANAALDELAGRRASADQTLASALAFQSSEAWGALSCTAPTATGSQRDLADDRVLEIFNSFRYGSGAKGSVLGPDDPFVTTLMQSAHVMSARNAILDALRSGDLTATTVDYHLDRRISNNWGVFLNDAIAVLHASDTAPEANTNPQFANLPEAFLGSYSMQVRASDPKPDGGVVVTYIINNDTTIDSATRIPGTGGAHLPQYGWMLHENNVSGAWDARHQTIVWSETVYP